MIKNLKEGMKLTLVSIDSMMAMSHRKELVIKSILTEPIRGGYQNENLRVGTFSERGKRKEFYLDVKRDHLYFEGWGLPLRVDTDKTLPFTSGSGMVCTTMRGNACYNFTGERELIIDYLKNRQINDEVTDETLGKCLIVNNEKEEILFPEIESHHAVIERLSAEGGKQNEI